MKYQLNLSLSPKQAAVEELYNIEIAKQLNVDVNSISAVIVIRRSIDARSKNVKVNLGVSVFVDESPSEIEKIHFDYQNVSTKPEVIIVGAGPAGLLAALRLIELGLKPVIFERGKNVSKRKKDIAAIHRNEGVDPDSNYGFGEGGAGTFSDGKLYTRSKKRGDINRILHILHQNGAQDDILIDAHPHIGTNVLPRVIESIRERIKQAGGEMHFEKRVSGFICDSDTIKGIQIQGGESHTAKAVILATGHSARDIYYLLRESGIHIEAKNFAMGVRVEHPQQLIDSIQYHSANRGHYLPAASYSFAEQVNDRGVYSFCMCPGGIIVPAATANDQMVVNGMSPSSREGDHANSGIVTEVRIGDLKQYSNHREFAGLKFQEDLERKSYKMAMQSQTAPAQRLADFVSNKDSKNLPKTSYHPGVLESDLHRWLPPQISSRLQIGFQKMGKKAKGFLTNEAMILGVESRTSSPIRIPRNPETLQHVKMKGLFPCGEGAGYAGGIVSSAIDGERCAEKVYEMMSGKVLSPSSEFRTNN